MAKTKAKTSSLSSFQKFEIQRIHRRDLKNSPYNPRTLSDEARVKLKHILKTHGVVQPPTWNRRTGNLVGGHQRVSIIDSLGKTADYLLDVAVIDVPLKQEKAINIALNNVSAQGEFDPEQMLLLAKEAAAGDLDLAAAGMSKLDMEMLLADVAGAETIFSRNEDNDAVLETLEKIDEDAGEARKARRGGKVKEPEGKPGETMIAEIKKNRETWRAERQQRDDSEFYVVVVFDDRKGREQFLSRIGVAKDERYVSGGTLSRKLK